MVLDHQQNATGFSESYVKEEWCHFGSLLIVCVDCYGTLVQEIQKLNNARLAEIEMDGDKYTSYEKIGRKEQYWKKRDRM